MKKSYKGFIVWLVLFIIGMFMIPFLSLKDNKLVTLIILNYMILMIDILMILMHYSHSIYWLNGIEFEKVCKMSIEKIEQVSKKYIELFTLAVFISLLYSIISYYLKLNYGIDIFVISLILVSASFYTITIHL